MSNPFDIGPIAPERNPPITPQYYQPTAFNITAISLGPTTTFTITSPPYLPVPIANNFVLGQLVRILIPFTYGTRQLNEQTGYVIALSSNQVTVNINSTKYDPFIANPAYGPTLPQILPIGDVNSGAINTTGRIQNGTTILGSFQNISPL